MLGLITGANRGLGLELVRLGLAQGDSILAACRNTDGEQMTELLTLKTDYPEFLEILQMDVTKEEEVKEAADKVRKKYGHIDFLINNAGVLFEKMKMPGDCIRDLDIDMLRRNLEVNVVGTALVCKYFIEQLYRSVCPCIMNITSEAAHLSPIKELFGRREKRIAYAHLYDTSRTYGYCHGERKCPDTSERGGRRNLCYFERTERNSAYGNTVY